MGRVDLCVDGEHEHDRRDKTRSVGDGRRGMVSAGSLEGDAIGGRWREGATRATLARLAVSGNFSLFRSTRVFDTCADGVCGRG